MRSLLIPFTAATLLCACGKDDGLELEPLPELVPLTESALMAADWLLFESIVNGQTIQVDTSRTECRSVAGFAADGAFKATSPQPSIGCNDGSFTVADAIDWRLNGDTLIFTREFSSLEGTFRERYLSELSSAGELTMRFVPVNPSPNPINGKLHRLVRTY